MKRWGIPFLAIGGGLLLGFTPWGRALLRTTWGDFILWDIMPWVLIMMPLGMVLLTRTHPLSGARGEFQSNRMDALRFRLVCATALGAIAVGVTQIWFPDFRIGVSVIGYMPIESLWARPLRAAMNSTSGKARIMEPPLGPHAASLVPRAQLSPLSRGMWIALWSVLACSMTAALLALAWNSRAARMEDCLIALGIALATLILAPLALQWWLQQPEPLDDSGSEELRREWARLRRVKSLGTWGVAAAIAVPCCLFAITNGAGIQRLSNFSVLLIVFTPAVASWLLAISYHTQRRRAIVLLHRLQGGEASQ